MKRQTINSKKGSEIAPVILILALMLGFSVFYIQRAGEINSNSDNPFYGELGEREIYIQALESGVEGDLHELDVNSRYSLHRMLDEESEKFFMGENPSCGSYLDLPIKNIGSRRCPRNEDTLSEFSKYLIDKGNDYIYDGLIRSDIKFPFNYKYSLIKRENLLTFNAVALQPVEYALRSDASEKPELEIDAQEQNPPDYSTECTYVFKNIALAADISKKSRSEFIDFSSRGFQYSVGPCPEGLAPKLVPYYNQDNIVACNQKRSCPVDEEEIRRYGCSFKSHQMAFAYYDLFFDEMQSDNTDDVISLITEIQDIAEQSEKIEFDKTLKLVNHERSEITDVEDPYSETTFSIIDPIMDKHYNDLKEKLDDGLAIVRIRGKDPGEIECQSFEPEDDELGYCPQQHFFLVTNANENYVIINDPYTPGRDFRSGINLVLSKEFFSKIWTGEYRLITEKNE